MPSVLQHAPAQASRWALLLIAALTAAPQVTVQSQLAPPRKTVDREWVGIWKTGDAGDDDLFAFPRELVATRDGVYILDIGSLEVIAFDPLGRRRWVAGSKGQGPGQFIQPVDITIAPDGDIAVLDPGNGRVTFFAPTGTFRRSRAMPGAANATGVCFTNDARMHLWVAQRNASLLTVEMNGKARRTRTFPWPVPPGSPEFLRTSFFARGVPSNECAFATLFGFGVGRLAADGRVTTSPYVEHVSAPTLVQERLKGGTVETTMTQGVNAGSAAMRAGDTVMVKFAGNSPAARRVLDLYRPPQGYLESWPIPACTSVAYHAPWLYCMTNMSESPRLVAFAAKSDTARVLKLFPASARGKPKASGKRQPGS